ncbi:SOS response-associated peptidase family protein [Pseudomonas sp. 10-1B]|uniref:SOS response-associated peptidase family protein n=1 Tax=Pseudomonas sp. 10-1B TaxID=1546029 RepID=UPI00068475AB|nr:SOS response-associated peptidase family protein [Pseudomonas sp. 10-1B]
MCKQLAQFGSVVELTATLSLGPEVGQGQTLGSVITPESSAGLLHAENDELVFDQIRWGWCPRWANAHSLQAFAPADKVSHSPYWKPVWQHRALCPVNGWFEWQNEDTQVYYVRRRDRNPCLIAAAGQYPRQDRGALPGDGFVLLAAEHRAAVAVERAHMPVVLPPALAREWLDSDTDRNRAEYIVREQGEPVETFEAIALELDPCSMSMFDVESLRKL